METVAEIDANGNLLTNNNKYPHEIRDLDSKVCEDLMQYFTGEHTGFVQVGETKYFMPHKFKSCAANFYNMDVRPDDTWVVSYPRSGTTWTQELVWMVANNLDYEGAAAVPLTDRFPFLEFSVCVHDVMKNKFKKENSYDREKEELVEHISQPGWELVARLPSPRFIKTHLPLSLLPPTLLTSGCKVIYVARNPKDVVVSFYHLNRLMRTQGYIGDFPKFWNVFRNNLHHWTPFFPHLKEAWDARDHPDLLFLFYEDLSKDLPASIRKVASFFGKKYSERQIQGLSSHLYIDNFKNNKSVNYDVMKLLGISKSTEQSFIRNGKSGSWKELFTQELSKEADDWIAENLKNTDMRFPTDL